MTVLSHISLGFWKWTAICQERRMNNPHARSTSHVEHILPSGVGPNLWHFEELEETFDNGGDLICFSHLRWDFVYQRPQHLMSRCARERRVFFVEEPVFRSGPPALALRVVESGVCVVVPEIPDSASPSEFNGILIGLMDDLYSRCGIKDSTLWYYAPMARSFTQHLPSQAIVFDCMDELSLFKDAPATIREAELELMSKADVVFTGGVSLYEAKRHLHKNIYAVPSSIDVLHFHRARMLPQDAGNLKDIPHPRLGFAGVIDERLDQELLDELSRTHPEWQFIMIGPVVKVDPAALPHRGNIHYLGQQPYSELPAYLAGLDVALLPFARNQSTRYISPTKTPEYLAAGRPVVSTSIRDVVRPYGERELVRIADAPVDFADAISAALQDASDPAVYSGWLAEVDAFLSHMSWDRTWMYMMELLDKAIAKREVAVRSHAAMP